MDKLIIISAIFGVIFLIRIIRKEISSYKRAKSIKCAVPKLCILLILLVSSKFLYILIRFLSLFTVFIISDIYVWVVTKSVSVWAIGHPCVHSVQKIIRHIMQWMKRYNW